MQHNLYRHVMPDKLVKDNYMYMVYVIIGIAFYFLRNAFDTSWYLDIDLPNSLTNKLIF